MEKIDLSFEHFNLPEKVNLLIQHCNEAGDEFCSHSEEDGGIPEFVAADGRISWQLLNSVVKQTLPDRTPVFCEWGSGTGLVTLIASFMGMSATGIEIEEDLIDLARETSREYAIPATFIHGSIYPKDNPTPLINYQQVDLFFAYPWPNQITHMSNLFKRVAVEGAILVVYHGGHNYRVLRR